MRALLGKIKYFLYRKLSFNKNIILNRKVKINKGTHFEGYNRIGIDTEILNSYIGIFSYLGHGNRLNNTIIGKFCSIGSNIEIVSGNHPTKNFVSTHPVFYSVNNNFIKKFNINFIKRQKFNEYYHSKDNYLVSIGSDVWIGDNVKILNGVTIGNGAVLATGAVVVNDVKDFEIVGGVPAKKIRYRFNNDIISYLLKLEWWNKDLSWIKKHADLFEDIESLMKVEII